MTHLKLMTTIAISLALPVFADSPRKGGRDNDRQDLRGRQEMRRTPQRADRRVVVAPRPVRPMRAVPVYPAYPPAPVYVPAPYYGASAYIPSPPPEPAEIWNEDPRGYPDDSYAYSGNPNDGYADYAPYAPPPPQQEVYGPAPGPGYVWASGFWRWGGVSFAWTPGQWTRPPRAGASWTAGSWFQVNGRFGFRRGFWR